MTADIYQALPYFITHSGVSILDNTEFHPMKLPQTTTNLPAVFYQDISTVSISAHGEASFLPKKRFQFTCVGVTLASIIPIMQALKARLDGYQGNMGTGSYVTEVEASIIKDERVLDDPETNLVWMQQDYLIIYKE